METSTSRPVDAAASLRGWQRWTVFGLAALAGVGLVSTVVTSRVFHVRTLDVSGESHLGAAEVIRLSGITRRTSVLWLDAGEVESRLESDPWIERAVLEKDLPSEVRITIEERSPVAATRRGPELALVAGDGTVLGPTTGDQGLPLVIATWTPTDGATTEALTGAALALRTMEPSLRAGIEEVTVAPDGAIELRLTSGTRILYGPPTEVAEKAEALLALLRWAEAKSSPLASVDVRSPGTPTALLGSPAPQ